MKTKLCWPSQTLSVLTETLFSLTISNMLVIFFFLSVLSCLFYTLLQTCSCKTCGVFGIWEFRIFYFSHYNMAYYETDFTVKFVLMTICRTLYSTSRLAIRLNYLQICQGNSITSNCPEFLFSINLC